MRWTSALELSLVVLGAWTSDVHAFGCQASGALPIFPSDGAICSAALEVGDTVDLAITVTNTSSSVPLPGTNVSARLVNHCIGGPNNAGPCTVPSECPGGSCGPAATYTLACTTTACGTALPGMLTFVPVGGNGCVANVPAVTSCAASGTDPNQVEIRVDASGLPLAAGATQVPFATIRVQVMSALPFSMTNPCGQIGTRVDTMNNSIVTTDGQCDAPATGGASGSNHLFLPEPTISPTPAPTPTPAVCAAAPATTCRQPTAPAKSMLLLADRIPDRRDLLKWKWTRGAATLKADFGDPLAATRDTLCVYDETSGAPSLVLAASVPPGGTCDGRACWQETTRGFKYADQAGTRDGVVRLVLQQGLEGRANLALEARGDDVAMPALPLAQDSKVTVQLANDGGVCWEARYGAPAIRNEQGEFRDKSD